MDTSLVVATTTGLVGADSGVELEGRDVGAVAARASRIDVLVDTDTMLSRDVGGAWSKARRVQATGTCVLSTADGALVGTEDARLALVAHNGTSFVETFDQAPGRADWYTPWGGPPATRSLAIDGAGTWYVNVHVGGILRSPDQGATWEQTIDIHSDVHQVAAHPTVTGDLFAATGWGLGRLEPGSSEWTFHSDGLHAHYCRAAAVTPDAVYLSASEGPRGGGAALYRADLRRGGDLSFHRCNAGAGLFDGNIDTYWLDSDGDRVAFATAAGSVFVSSDRGESWGEMLSGVGGVRAVKLLS